MKIKYAGRIYGFKEKWNLFRAAHEFWLTEGRWTKKFETEFSKYLFGCKNSIPLGYSSFVNSGSSANLLAFMALTQPELGDKRIKRGDEVITTACGFPTTISPIVQYGAVPVFVDITQFKCNYLNIFTGDGNADITQIKKAYTPKTKAIMLAHTLGSPFNIKEIKKFCEEKNIWLIEDNCDSLGAQYLHTIQLTKLCCMSFYKKTGTAGHISTHSFYPAHHITTGEGGMVCTSSLQLYKIINSLKNWGRDCVCGPGQDNVCKNRFGYKIGNINYDHKYIYSRFGYNLKATDLQAAIGCAQLQRLEYFVKRRNENWKDFYDGMLGMNNYGICQFHTSASASNGNTSRFGFLVICLGGKYMDRKTITSILEKRGVQTRLLFGGNLTKQPMFKSLKKGVDYRIVGNLKNTNYIAARGFWVGVYPGIRRKHIKYIVDILAEYDYQNVITGGK